jgi:hypothetical protein
LGLFWFHFARISLRRSIVSFILDIFGGAAGSAVWADAVTSMPETRDEEHGGEAIAGAKHGLFPDFVRWMKCDNVTSRDGEITVPAFLMPRSEYRDGTL